MAVPPPMMRGRGGPRLAAPVEEPYRINGRIRVPEVRLIIEGENGEEENLGVIATGQALRMAEERGQDLVEVAPQAQPPVCKIMDYGRFKYSMERKAREAHRAGKAGRAASDMKDVQLSPRIDDHDLNFKVERAREFLSQGHPVRMVVRFLGRDMRHPEVGMRTLQQALEVLGSTTAISVDQQPRMEGRQLFALVRLVKGAKVGEKKSDKASSNGTTGDERVDEVVATATAPSNGRANGAAVADGAAAGATVTPPQAAPPAAEPVGARA